MTTPNTLLRLDRLTLRNFRCYSGCTLDLHPNLTVLVADNGYGKTATLDGIGLALDVFVSEIAHKKQSLGFDRSDVHQVRGGEGRMASILPTAFSATGFLGDAPITWGRTLPRLGIHRARNTTRDTKDIRRVAQQLRDHADAEGTDATGRMLPLVVFYGTGRLWSEHRATEKKRTVWPTALGRYSAYLDCLSSSSSFKAFVAWFEERANAARSAVSKAYGPGERPHEHLAAVKEAVRTVLEPTGWTSIDWEFPTVGPNSMPEGSGFLAVEHPEHGRIPLAFLSDGIRNMVALAGDLAHRCVRLNPHLGEQAARLTPGILLIDEVDMHLHPRWQQLVVDLLRKAFPAMQMILTTHSPHVLSTVDKDSIRAIYIDNGQGTFTTPELQTRGVESADVLAAIMRVNPIPQVEQARWLYDYRALIDTGVHDTQDGQTLRARLLTHFGAQHPVMLDCDRLIRFQAFKRRQSQSEKD